MQKARIRLSGTNPMMLDDICGLVKGIAQRPFVVIGALAVAVIELLVARSVRSHGPTESAPHVQSIT